MTLTCARRFQKPCKFSSPRQFLVHLGDRSFVDLITFSCCSEDPAWKRLISHTLDAHERISLVTTIFSDRDQVKMVGHLSGSNAQTFIDMIDEVSLILNFTSVDGWIDSDSNPLVLSIRCWMVLHHSSAGGVCVTCTGFVVAKPWFRDR